MEKHRTLALALAVRLSASSLAACAQTQPKEPGEETNPSLEIVNLKIWE